MSVCFSCEEPKNIAEFMAVDYGYPLCLFHADLAIIAGWKIEKITTETNELEALRTQLAEQEARVAEYEKILKDILLYKILDNYILERAYKALNESEMK